MKSSTGNLSNGVYERKISLPLNSTSNHENKGLFEVEVLTPSGLHETALASSVGKQNLISMDSQTQDKSIQTDCLTPYFEVNRPEEDSHHHLANVDNVSNAAVSRASDNSENFNYRSDSNYDFSIRMKYLKPPQYSQPNQNVNLRNLNTSPETFPQFPQAVAAEGKYETIDIQYLLDYLRVKSNQNYSAPSESMYTYYCSEFGEISRANLEGFYDFKSESLDNLLKRENYWLNVQNPSVDSMKLLASIFKIHPLTTEDILQEGTREKIEVYNNYYFICYAAIDTNMNSETYSQYFNVYLLVFPKYLVSFHSRPLNSLYSVLKRLDQLKAFLNVTPHWITYALLDDITDKYVPIIHSIELEVESIDDLVLVISHNEQSDMLRRISLARRRLTTLQRLLGSKADVLRLFIKRLESVSNGTVTIGMTNTWSPFQAAMIKDTCLYLGDVQDHVITMSQTLNHMDNTLTRSHSNYLGQVSIEITEASNKSNDLMAKLTGLASIVVPLNIITGLWGMNVKVPGMVQEGDDYRWFIGIVVFMGLVAFIGIVYVRRLKSQMKGE